MVIAFTVVGRDDIDQFRSVADDVFDSDLSADTLQSFLTNESHHMVIARAGDTIIGFVSAVDYIHPDKPREMWINEVGVAKAWRGQQIAKKLVSKMLDHGRTIGCTEAWVLADPDNVAANSLYRALAAKHDPEPTTAVMHTFKLI